MVGGIGGAPTLRGLTTVQSAITVGGTANADTVVVTATDANSGSYTLNGGTPVTFSGITTFSFIAGVGADKLTINNPAGGVFALAGGITYHAGGDANDVLEVLGGAANSGTFTPAATAGTGTLTHVGATATQTITINKITGFTDTTAEPTFDINGTGGADTFSLFDGTVQSGVQLSQVTFTPAGLSPIGIFYGNKPATNLLGQDGTDLFNLGNTSNLTNINGGNDNDRLLFTNANAIATLSGGSFDGGAGTDTIDYGVTPTAVRVNLGLTNNMTVEMDMTQENGFVETTATASGTVTYDASNRQVNINLTVNNMFNKITNFHIHLNPTGVDGAVIVPIGAGVFNTTATAGQFTVNTSVTLPELNEAALLGGHTYLNIHTDINSGGEIRGQILPGANVNLGGNGFASGTGSISNVENVLGTSSNDSIVGSIAANNLNGVGGNDIIVGGPGADTMVGGDGNDVLVWNNGDGSDVMDGGNDADTVQVNGNANAETFTLADNGARAEFKRTSTGPFTLDIGTTETLRLNANSGDDTFTVSALTTAGSGMTTLQGFGFNGNDSFTANGVATSGGMRFNGNLGTNSLTVTNSNVSGAVTNNDGIDGNGLFGQFLGTVDVNNSTFNNNAQHGVNLTRVGDVNLTNLTTDMDTASGVSLIGLVPSLQIGGTSPAKLTAASGIELNGFINYHAQVNGISAGSQYDQIVASHVLLSSPLLSFELGFVPTAGQSFTLIDNTGNQPVAGTFAGLGEGAVFTVNGIDFAMSYKGGTGNDVVVSVAAPPVFTSPNRFVVPVNQQFTFNVTTTGIPPASISVSGGLPSGVSYINNNDGTGTLFGKTSENGTFNLLFNASNGAGIALQIFQLVISEHLFVVGAGPGRSPDVLVYANDGSLRFSFMAYDQRFTGGVNVATVDYNKDGVDDIITGAASNGGPHVKVFDGRNLNQLASFFAYDASFQGGVFVAGGDINNDGFVDIITGANAGGGPHVKAFSGFNLIELRSFYAYDGNFKGGVRVAAGDVNDDGFVDIITGAGPGGGPHVEAFSGADNKVLRSFYAFEEKFNGGVFVASGDLNGDGADDIITGADTGGGPHVVAVNGLNLATLQTFYAFDAAFTGGVRVAAEDLDGDGKDDILTGAGPGGGPHVQAFRGTNLAVQQSFFAFDPAFIGGVYVG